MDGQRTKRLIDYLDAYPESVRQVAKAVLSAELGKLHLQNPTNIKLEIRSIVEREVERSRADREPQA